MFKGRWVGVQITAPPHICTGYVYCLEGRRLCDQLNDVFPGTVPPKKDFLSVSDIKMYSVTGVGEEVPFACFNKANMLFVREVEEGQTRGLGAEPGYKHYPYVAKSPKAVKLYMPSYILTGHMHCAQGERVSDVLNSELRFLPLTNVEISSSVGSESGISFVAVNRGQIVLLEEGGERPA